MADFKDCIFCKIAKGEIPCKKVFEDSDHLAFLDISPASKGHTLIIPKRHSKNIHEMDAVDYYELMKVMRDLKKRMESALGVDRAIVHIDGMDVHHTHIHLIPLNRGSGGIRFEKTSYSEGESDNLAKRIINYK